MKVLNIHSRVINADIDTVTRAISTLATKDDKVWPKETWPKMKLSKGLEVGSQGGHGPIGYRITEYVPGNLIVFQFQKPKGFHGFHKFEITEISPSSTKVKHTIDMQSKGLGTFQWIFGVRALHDALIEDAFDKMENLLAGENLSTDWSLWVMVLRKVLK